MTDEIALRLAETVAWCKHHALADDADASMRSLALCPPVMALPQQERLTWLVGHPGVPQRAVEFVCQTRRRELARLGIPVPPVGADLAGGRVLFTNLATDSCEAATGPSNGFYDVDDLPGWNTWFWHRPSDDPCGAIYCWMPSHLVELAQAGMDVIPVNCVRWAESLE